MESEQAAARARALDLLDQLTALEKRQKRESVLLAEFRDGFVFGWHMAVPERFRDALDIKWRERKVAGESTSVWIQSGEFHFKTGDVLYDSPDAYGPWPDGLKHLGCCLAVNDSAAAVLAKPAAVQPATESDVPRDPGFVTFDVLVPNSERTALTRTAQQTLTQDAFVRFLISGEPGLT